MAVKLFIVALLACWQVIAFAASFDEGEVIYMKGVDNQGKRIPAVMKDLVSFSPLACVNCHRESGFGSSESGQTFPPVSWHFLGRNQPEDDSSRFYQIQNKRKAYDADSFYRLLTTGVNSNGKEADGMMPKYAISRHQSDALIKYLKTIYTSNDPGVDGNNLKIATIVDKRLPQVLRDQHIAFLKGLFGMKNSLSRDELKRKQNSPIQKVPQYESFRIWELVVWELPEDTSLWSTTLSEFYQQNPVFSIIRPRVKNDYNKVAEFCTDNKIPCFFPSGENLPAGDFYNFVFRNRPKQLIDYLSKKRRARSGKLLYVNDQSEIQMLDKNLQDIPLIKKINLEKLQQQYEQYCTEDSTLLLKVNVEHAAGLEVLHCTLNSKMNISVIIDRATSYQALTDYNRQYPDSQICWVSDYSKVLKRNLRSVRVNAMVKRFNIQNPDGEELAKTLLTYGLLTDTLHKMAGNFSRLYMMEIIEHMLNSFLNYTYFSSITGAPYQRYIVGPIDEYCAGGKNI